MEISHLVVAGCSWTYCQGLDSPNTQGWPALLGNFLKVPVVNLARPGLGNDAIHRRIYEYTIEDISNNNNPLYIIAWTQSWRREAWCRNIYNPKDVNGYYIVAMPNEVPENNLEKALLDTWSEEDFYRRLTLYRLSVDSLLKSKNINYLSSFFAKEEYNNGRNSCADIIADIKNRFSNTQEYLKNNTNRIRNFYELTTNLPKTKCGHEGVEANQVIANYLINTIKQKYPNIKSTVKPFLSLKDFEKKTDPYGPFNSHWF